MAGFLLKLAKSKKPWLELETIRLFVRCRKCQTVSWLDCLKRLLCFPFIFMFLAKNFIEQNVIMHVCMLLYVILHFIPISARQQKKTLERWYHFFSLSVMISGQILSFSYKCYSHVPENKWRCKLIGHFAQINVWRVMDYSHNSYKQFV